MKQRFGAVLASAGAGTVGALWPLAALAAEGSDFESANRALNAPGDLGSVMLVTAGALVGLFVLTALGYLYRRQRGLDWTFQRPDTPHDEHH